MKKLFLISFLLFFNAQTSFGAVNVITSIKPLHSLVANLVDGTKITSDVLVDGNASPHDFALKPKQVEAINNAKLVFYIDEHFEGFLDKALENAPKNVAKFSIIDNTKIKLLEVRKSANWEPHQHHEHESHEEHNHEGHNHEKHGENEAHDNKGSYDLHVWLSVKNASIISDFLAGEIIKKFPDEKAAITKNLANLKTKLNALDNKISTELKPLKNKPYIMFHDAFQYFENDYNLGSVGSITIDPEQSPNPKRIVEIREKLIEIKAECVFSEPQFDAKLVNTVIEGTNARTNILDESGASFKKGKDLYFDLMNQISGNLTECLK
jgi:zinc transport system substrate-binding protein